VNTTHTPRRVLCAVCGRVIPSQDVDTIETIYGGVLTLYACVGDGGCGWTAGWECDE